MNLEVEWGKIKNGYSGFEKLACKYVEMNFPNPSWVQTSETRDGNKDAVAIFCGYKKDKTTNEKWWMEAKYSTSINTLSRYRLDATIVSAILEREIKKIIFVTNITIKAKTINDIRNALYNSIHCTDVTFCTRHSLEYWLSNNIDIYQEFFNITNNNLKLKIAPPSLFVMTEIEYYSEVSNVFSFREPLRELYMKDTYIGYFEVFSSSAQQVSLRPHPKMIGITILTDTNIQLSAGENSIKFIIYIDEYEYNIDGIMYSPAFLLNDMEVLSAQHIIPIKKGKSTFELFSQKQLIENLNKKYTEFIKDKNYSFNFIEGTSGSGKSYILENFLKDSILPTKEIFFAEFTNSPKTNNEILVHLLLFILFPFVNPIDVDIDYIKKIRDNFTGYSIIDLVENKRDFDSLAQIMSVYTIDDSIFPIKMSIYERVILLDDLQKLTNYEANFLSVIIADMQRHNLPIFALFSAQPSYYKNQSYKNILEHCVLTHYDYAIRLNDIFRALPSLKKNSIYLNQDLTYSMEFNVVELFLLSKYILDNEITINNIHEFVEICKIFQRTSVLELYILKQFNNLFYTCPQTRDICDSIYWACEPKQIDIYNYNIELNLLLSNGLVKYNFDSCLIPAHDIYKAVYCKHFKPNIFDESEYEEDSVELIKYRMEHGNDQRLLLEQTHKIIKLSENQKFYSVMFILEDIFETCQKEKLRCQLDKVTYYKLYFAYALSATQQSVNKAGYDIFLELGNEIRGISIPEILELSISTDWDLAIGDYERLRYEKAFQRLKSIIVSLLKLKEFEGRSNNLLDYSQYYDVLMLDTLLRANKEEPIRKIYDLRVLLMENHGFLDRSKSFQIRFALTLCTKNMDECLEILHRCGLYFEKKYGVEDKFYLWANYHYNYFFMVFKRQMDLINTVVKYHNKLRKNYYLNFRQRINGLASYYYYMGEITNGNKYLLLEASFNNELPMRQSAFYYETVALHEVLVNNFKEAKLALQKAIDIFNELPSYQQVAYHNLNLLQCINNIPTIEYWIGEKMNAKIYYIDIRCSW